MTREELRRAIERPAERVGLSVEPELVDTLLRDVEDQPGALPLLSTALLELWRSRDGRHLRLAAYARSGGVQGAVARLAEDAFLALDPAGQAAARRLLLRLSDEGSGRRRRAPADRARPARAGARRGRGPARRPPPADGLRRRRRGRARGAAARVAAAARLAGRGRAGPAPAPPAQRRRRAWDADDRDPGGLYRGARLAAALDWAAGHDRRARRDRARVPARQPARERARPAPPAPRARGRRLAARGRRRRRRPGARAARQRARRGDRWPPRSGSARRRSWRTISTGRCCSPVRAWRSTTRCRPAATCSRRCSRARRRSACCAATAGG